MTELTDRDPSDMSDEDLRDEWDECFHRCHFATIGEEEQNRVYDRRAELWNELEDRSDATYPDCPECGDSEWLQSPGDPKSCGTCGLELGFRHEDLIEKIDLAWNRILSVSRGEADA